MWSSIGCGRRSGSGSPVHNISYKKRGENLRGSIIDDEDIQIKISSFLRKEKFNVTVNNFKEFIAKDVFPSIGVENETAIRWEEEYFFL